MPKITKMTLNFPMGIDPLKRINTILRHHGKSKGDINPTIPFPEDSTYV